MQAILKKWEPALHVLAFLLVAGSYFLWGTYSQPFFYVREAVGLLYGVPGFVFFFKRLKGDAPGLLARASFYFVIGGFYFAADIITGALDSTVFYHG